MNIIIPLGGIGKRYSEHGYLQPKPLIKIFGKPILFWLIDSLKLEENDKIYVFYNPQLKNQNIERQIYHNYPNISCFQLPYMTEGAAQTLYEGIRRIEYSRKDLPVICIDGDNFFTIDILNIYRNSETKRGIFYFKDIQSNPIYSYIVLDDNNLIRNIVEKDKISNNACCGVYCFKNKDELHYYSENIIRNNERQKNEFYTSTLFLKMIENRLECKGFEINATNFHCLGTPLQSLVFCNNIPRHYALEDNILSIHIDKRRFCFDLDNTLVSPCKKKGDYSTVEPIHENINFARYLKRMGHTIIIHTARRMNTHGGNIGKILADIAKITFETLDNFGIPYDEIYFGKPIADYYIDDKAINAYNNLEKELGYYVSKIEERDFNSINAGLVETIIKRSNDYKLLGEIHWFETMPIEIKDLFPIYMKGTQYNLQDLYLNKQLICEKPYWYEIEKINGLTVSQLWITQTMKPDLIYHIMGSLNRIHNSYSHDMPLTMEKLYQNYSHKIKKRYNDYDYSKFDGSIELYNELITYFDIYEKERRGVQTLIHGDPVFTNILINSFGKIKFIDMRGLQGDIITKTGDKWYDYAKLYQSLIGYDEILLSKTIDNKIKNETITIFENIIIEKFGKEVLRDIKMITKSLLFSLLPLHDNDKCVDYYNLALSIKI